MRAFVPTFLVLFALMSAQAFAQSPSVNAYGGEAAVLAQPAAGADASVTPAAAAPNSAVAGATANDNGVAGANDNGVAGARTSGSYPSGAGASPSGPSAPQTLGSGSLPFTGMDIGLLVMGGVLLLGVGIVVRRFSALRDTA